MRREVRDKFERKCEVKNIEENVLILTMFVKKNVLLIYFLKKIAQTAEYSCNVQFK